MQAAPINVHCPANAHCCDFMQSLVWVATHTPFCSEQLPLVTHAPLNGQSGHEPNGVWQSASEVAAQAPLTRYTPERPHGIWLWNSRRR
jgi:hypothetical protein